MSPPPSSGLPRIQTSDQYPGPELLERAGTALAEGGVVALPTETVYGLAVRADRPAALGALARLKSRPPALHWTWHVGALAALERFPALSAPARRLARRYWPGPLTLVLPGAPPGLEAVAREGWTGVRCVAHAATAGLLNALDFPVVMTSANVHGGDPAADADQVAREFESGLALLVDGGAARLGEPSSVLRVGRGRFELLREGLHDLPQLRAAAGLRIGFACTGNTCRSPMAAGLARHAIAERLECVDISDFGFELHSMGVFASSGAPASAQAVTALAERGIAIGVHRSSAASIEAVQELDVVYCMTAAHVAALRLLLPPGRDGNVEMLDPAGGDVPDPLGGTLQDYRRCAQRIAECIAAHLDEWA